MFRLFRPTYTVNGETRQSRVFWAEFTLRNGIKIRESLKTRTWETAWKVAQAREASLLLEQAANAQESPQTRRQTVNGSPPPPTASDPSTAILAQLQPLLQETIGHDVQAALVQALAQVISGLVAGQISPAGGKLKSGGLVKAGAVESCSASSMALPLAGGVDLHNTHSGEKSDGKTLRHASNDFLRTLKATRAKSTFMTARSAMNRVLEILGRDRPAESITQADVIRLIERLKAEKLSARTVNLAVSHLARALGGTAKSLWPGLRKLRENADAGRALSDAEIRRLLEEADRLAAGDEAITVSDSRRGEWTQTIGPRGVLLPCFLRLLLYTGMRSGEAKTLRWRHVDFQKGLISVPGTKTDAARRVIPMHPDLVRVLEQHRDWYVSRFGRTEADWFVFPAGSPAPNNPRKPISDFKHAWETVREKSGVKCRMHDLRHTFISRLAESGVPEVTLMELAGHVSRSMLLRYSHPRIEARREAVRAIKL